MEFNWQLETVAPSEPSSHCLQKGKIDCDSESLQLEGEGPAQSREASAGPHNTGTLGKHNALFIAIKGKTEVLS